MLFLAIFLFVYDCQWLLHVMSVGLFCSDFIYSKMFIFGAFTRKMNVLELISLNILQINHTTDKPLSHAIFLVEQNKSHTRITFDLAYTALMVSATILYARYLCSRACATIGYLVYKRRYGILNSSQ